MNSDLLSALAADVGTSGLFSARLRGRDRFVLVAVHSTRSTELCRFRLRADLG